MKKTRYAEERLAFSLKQAETGTRVCKRAERWEFQKPRFTTGRRSENQRSLI